MSRIVHWLIIGSLLIILNGCWNNGGNSEQSLSMREQNSTIVIDNDNVNNIINRTIDESNNSTKTILINESLANEIGDDKKIISIAQSEQFPLGYTGKILKRHKNNDGNTELTLEDITLDDISNINLPKKNYDIQKMNFIGIITPQGIIKAEKPQSKKLAKVVVDKSFPIHFDGEDIYLQSETGAKYTYDISEHATIELSGKISDLKLDNQGEFKIDVLNLSNESTDKIIKVDFWDKMKMQYNLDFELALKGELKGKVGHFDEEWKAMEKVAFEDFGISINGSINGLQSEDKKGKIPVAGFIYNGVFKSSLGKPDYKLIKGGGIIIWVYIDLSGEISLEGEIGVAGHSHTEINFIKNKNESTASVTSKVTAQKDKRYLEAPYVDGNLDLSISNGLAVEIDVIVGGIRVLNVGGEVKAEFSEELRTSKRLSYGIDNPDDEWKWQNGTVCYDGSMGAGFIGTANFLAGAEYNGSLGSLDVQSKLNFQYPDQDDIDNLTTGRVGTWYKAQLNRRCIDIPSPPEAIRNHVEEVRKSISVEDFKSISDEYYKFAYLSNRIYDTEEDEGKKENGWETISIATNLNGFKAGLYKNLFTGEFIISYGGTGASSYNTALGRSFDSAIDILTGLTLLTPISLGQPTNALQFYDSVKSKGISGIAGHSLGGGLAQYVGLYSGIKTVTFNTAPLPFNSTGSYLSFKDVITVTRSNDLVKSVKFLHEDKITNIMTPYDPVSTVSTAIMAIDDESAAFLMPTRFLLAISPIQKLDFLITGEKIYMPVDNQEGILNFSNHSMDLIENMFNSYTNFQADYSLNINGNSVSTSDILITDIYGNNINTRINKQSVYDSNGNLVGEYGPGEIIESLSIGTYTIKVELMLDDGRIITVEKTFEIQFSNTPPVANAGEDQTLTYGNEVVLDGSDSFDPDGTITSYEWTEGSVVVGNNARVTLENVSIGQHAYILTVKDEHGATNSDSVSITVEGPTLIASYYLAKKTGQIKSYNTDGDEVSYGTIKDDGYYQAGVATSYTRYSSKEVVLDNITGLMWQDNGDVENIKKSYVTQANFDDYLNTSGDTAATYCSDMTLGGYSDWRLPSVLELLEIIDPTKSAAPGAATSSTMPLVFQHAAPSTDMSVHHTSAKEDDTGSVRMGISFYFGLTLIYYPNSKEFVRCVRKEENRPKGGNIQRIWERKNPDQQYSIMQWEDAISYCEDFSQDGITDWRLPTRNELLDPIIEGHYWSSTSYKPYGNDTAIVGGISPNVYIWSYPKEWASTARCVH